MAFFRRGSGRLSPVQAEERVAQGRAVLMDVREGSEWRAGHAPGALHLPLSRLEAGVAVPSGRAGPAGGGDLPLRAPLAAGR